LQQPESAIMRKKYLLYIIGFVCILVAVAVLFYYKPHYIPKGFSNQKVIITDTGTFKDADGSRPNIIIILGDDVGYDAIAANGNQSFATPNIDRMAKEGMNFTQCYGSPLCSPSRVMLVTGKYSFRNFKEWGVMDPKEKTFANILRDAGYATYVAGKWQFDGGHNSITSFGFSGYCVWDALEYDTHGSIYKNPRTYENGVFSTKEANTNKFGDDIFTDRILSFIQKNKTKNFLVYYPIGLCHPPFTPTPDDPEFAAWVNGGKESDSSFFPSMVKYMDKKTGQIIDSIKAWNLYNNTIIMFVGDNGTPKGVSYYYDGKLTTGRKGSTTSAGTHVPFMVTWPNTIKPAQVNNNLIDFTDFLPTIAEAVGLTVPASHGVIDGKSFYAQLTGQPSKPRDWIFCDFNAHNGSNSKLTRWVQDTTYKLYDVSEKFYNIVLDPEEKNPIHPASITPEEEKIKKHLQHTMNKLHN